MRLMILENKKLRAVVPAKSGDLSIGSNPACAIHLPDPRIGSQQARLNQDAEGVWWLEVLDTSLPTCLNRAVQKGRARVNHADEIELGTFSIRLFMDSDKTREELQRERMAALTRQHTESLPLGAIIRRFEHNVGVAKDQIIEMTILAIRLGQSETVREMLIPILRAILRTLRGRRAWIGVRAESHGPFDWTLGLNDQGQPCERPLFCERMETRCLNGTQYIGCPETPAAGVGSALAVPLAGASGNFGMLYVENDANDEPYTGELLDLFGALACCVGPPVETVVRRTLSKRQAVMSTEQTVARATQDAITPKALPQWNDLQVAAYRQMGSQRCCDYYDIVQLPDKTASIIVARLNVEGLALPRYLAETRAAFRSCALHCDAPHMFARALNWMIAGGDARHVIDLATVWIVPATGKVHYTLAGGGVHLGVVRSDGTCADLNLRRADSIGRAKTGALEALPIDLDRGDTLVLASQGVESIRNSEGAVFGYQGLEDSLCDGVGTAPGPALAELSQDLEDYLDGGECAEDFTVVLARRV